MYVKYIPKSEFIRNSITLMTGTTLAQAIPIAIAPVLTRLYTPEDFGLFALLMSVVAVIGVIATARYELAIMLPKEDSDALNILALSVIVAVLISLVTLVCIIIFRDKIVDFFKKPQISDWLFFIPVSILLTGIYQAFNYWSTRKKNFMNNSLSKISMSGTTALTNVGLGYQGVGAAGLVSGAIAGQIVSTILIATRSWPDINRMRSSVSLANIKLNLKKYKSFPMINAPHTMVDALQDHGIVFFISYYFTSTIVGLYSFTFRILKAPVGLIGSSMYQVFFQKATNSVHQGDNLQPLVMKLYKKLFILGFPAFLLLFIFAPVIFNFVFGEEWGEAGLIAQILTPWLFFNFIASPVSSLPLILNKQKQAFLITIIDISVRIAALIIGGIFHDYKLSFIIISCSCSMILALSLVWYYKIAANKEVII